MTAVALGTNGDFDAGIGVWQPWNTFNDPSSVAQDTSFTRSGAGSLRHVRAAGAAVSGSIAASTPWAETPPVDDDRPTGPMVVIPPAGPGTVTMTGWYYTAAASIDSGFASISLVDADGNVWAFPFQSFGVVHGAWTQVSGSDVVPEGLFGTVTRAILFVRADGAFPTLTPAVGAEIWWDDFTLDITPYVPAASGWVVGAVGW